MASRNKDFLLLLVLAFLVSAAEKRAHTAAGKMLSPGWYWWFVRWSTDRPQLEEWLRYNRGKAYVAKALGYTNADNAILILKVDAEVEWTLPGFPRPAPNGTSTSLPELERAPKPEWGKLPTEQDWRNFLDGLLHQAIDDVLSMDAKVQQWLDKVLR